MNVPEMVDRNLQLLETESGSYRALLHIDSDFVAFRGHFPDEPILPGITYPVIAERFACKALNKTLILTALKRTKFFQPAFPGVTLHISGKFTDNTENITGDVIFTDDARNKLSQVKLTLEKYA